MRLTVLAENTANRRGMLAEHGLSVLVETKGKRILFDTGQSDVFWRNACALGISLKNLDAVVLSHGHYDHCGGLKRLCQEGPLPPVFVGKGALEKKRCVQRDGTLRDIGIPWLPEDRTAFRENEGFLEPFPDVFLTSGIRQAADFEGVPALFVRGTGDAVERDGMQDEQLLSWKETACTSLRAAAMLASSAACAMRFPSFRRSGWAWCWRGCTFAAFRRSGWTPRSARSGSWIRTVWCRCTVPELWPSLR